MVTRLEMAEETKGKLVAAASRLFALRGYQSISVSDIAAAAGVTKGAFYHHYASKEDLLLYVQEMVLDRVIEESEEAIAEKLPVPKELSRLLHIQLFAMAKHREALLASVSERKSVAPEKWSKIRRKRDRLESLVAGCIARGQESGELALEGDPLLLTYGVLGMCYWSNFWFRGGRGGWSLEDVASSFSSLALQGLSGAERKR